MCGRFNVIDDPLLRAMMAELGFSFKVTTNQDLRPTQTVSTLAAPEGEIRQLDTRWGIKPAWSKKLLINAQAESVAEKRTFKRAFEERRCLVPCSGWYEWKDEGGKRKQRYSFARADGRPLLMAGIWYPSEEGEQLVTLTTKPTDECGKYHDRMPLFVAEDCIQSWINGDVTNATPLLYAPYSDTLRILKDDHTA